MNSENNSNSELFSRFKKRFNRKKTMLSVMSIVYTLILIPLLKILKGLDYSIVWQIVSTAVSISLTVQTILRSRSMKKQLEGLSEYNEEKICAELENAKPYGKIFYLTSEYLFSPEGAVLPYYEIEKMQTITYTSSPVATNIIIGTRSCGKVYVTVGFGYMRQNFYDELSRRCPQAEFTFRVNYQKADIDEYLETVKKESLFVIRKHKSNG